MSLKQPYSFYRYEVLGLLGECLVLYQSFIDCREFDRQASVMITSAVATCTLGPVTQEINLMGKLISDPELMREREDEIRDDWEKSRNADWERDDIA